MLKKPKGITLPEKPISSTEFITLAKEATDAVQQHRNAAQLAAETLAAGRAAFTAADGTREERITRTQNSALEFGRVYLSHYFEQVSPQFHHVLDRLIVGDYNEEDLLRWSKELGVEVHSGDPDLRLLAICIFRGGAKSTIAILLDYLRRICHGLDPYLFVASDTYDQAAAHLEDIKEELEFNEKIIADFGRLKPGKQISDAVWDSLEVIQGADGRVQWREGRIVTTNGIRVDAIGSGGKMRGRRHGSRRPTHGAVDDVDNDENVRSKDQRDYKWDWLIQAVLPAMDPNIGSLTIIGSTIHFDCTIARAVRKTDDEGNRLFTSIKFNAMRRNDAGEFESVWPERFTIKRLLSIRTLLGPSKFGAEYMNDPRDPDTQLFNPEKFTHYIPVELEGKKLRRILYVDPSKGKKGKGRKKSDFSGFADVLCDSENRISYVNNAFRLRLSPSAAKAKVVEWYLEAIKGRYQVELWVEENSFGDVFGETWQDELRRRGIDIVVNTKLHSVEKDSRLEKHSIRIETGGVRFPARWEGEGKRPDWFSEYEDYPGAFDDTIDALESADDIGMNDSAGQVDFTSAGEKSGSSRMKSSY
jgi:predicted phage terminase large subunit-like protein